MKDLLKKLLAYVDVFIGWRTHQSRDTLEAGVPWLPFPVIDWLNDHLTKDMVVFEWGSGGSTEYIAKRVKRIISVEHHPIWFTKVRFMLWLRRSRMFGCSSSSPTKWKHRLFIVLLGKKLRAFRLCRMRHSSIASPTILSI